MYVGVPYYNGVGSLLGRWGESAGAISVGFHMVTNGGDPEGLFRGAVMQSGSPTQASDLASQQATYDMFVSETGCSGSSDTLQCLRTVPTDDLLALVNKTANLFDPVQVIVQIIM